MVLTVAQVRLRILAGIMAAGLLVLVGRLWMLQLTRWVDYARAATGNRTSVTYAPAPRGMILDREGVVLAENRAVWNVSVVPNRLPKDERELERIIGRLASILRVPTPALRGDLAKARRVRGVEASPLAQCGQDVPLRVVAQIEEQALDLPGVVITQTFLRRYPHAQLAGHVLGYARAITAEQYAAVRDLNYPGQRAPTGPADVNAVRTDPIYAPDAVYGQAGLERQYEINLGLSPPLPVLTGRRGRTVYEVDAAGNRIRLIEERLPAVGATIYLTLNARVQQATEDGLRLAVKGSNRRTGAAVVLDVNNGEIIALASTPAIDPNDMSGRVSPARYRELTRDPRNVFLNKPVAGGYPPASTFKLVSTAAALEGLGLSPNKRFYCSGAINEGPQRFECWKPGGHGSVNLRQALAESCDVYFYELVRTMGLTPELLNEYARLFGLGEKTGLDLPEEIAGFVPDREWKRRVYKDRWWTGDSLNMVIGQGATTVTPLQIALVTAAVANGGDVLQPHLVRKIEWPEHMGVAPTVVGRTVRRHLNVRPETLAIIREGMRLAVTAAHGTGHAVAGLPVAVAGKTGSAEHISHRPTHAWFTCLAPYEHPRYVITVFISEGGHGGSVAAPVARKILAALFGFERPELVESAPVASD